MAGAETNGTNDAASNQNVASVQKTIDQFRARPGPSLPAPCNPLAALPNIIMSQIASSTHPCPRCKSGRIPFSSSATMCEKCRDVVTPKWRETENHRASKKPRIRKDKGKEREKATSQAEIGEGIAVNPDAGGGVGDTGRDAVLALTSKGKGTKKRKAQEMDETGGGTANDWAAVTKRLKSELLTIADDVTALKNASHPKAQNSVPRARPSIGRDLSFSRFSAPYVPVTGPTFQIPTAPGPAQVIAEPSTKKLAPPDGHHEEFQYASDLYANLRLLTTSRSSKAKSAAPNTPKPSLTFYGTFSIIAVPSINHIQRVKIVQKELKKLAKLRFNGTHIASIKSKMSQSRVFTCYCERSKSHRRIAAAEGSAPAVPDCGGKVWVTALDDNSHSTGMKGQMVKVAVTHGGSSG